MRPRPRAGIPVIHRVRRGAPPVLTPDYDGPDAVTCPRCGRRIPPGGGRRATHTIDGRLPGDGGVPCLPGAAEGRHDALPVITDEQARARRLVTIHMIARRFYMSRDTVRGWTREAGFPHPVAILDRPSATQPVLLFTAADVEAWSRVGPGKAKYRVQQALRRPRDG